VIANVLKSTTSKIYRKVEFRRAHVRVHVPGKGQVELIVVALAIEGEGVHCGAGCKCGSAAKPPGGGTRKNFDGRVPLGL